MADGLAPISPWILDGLRPSDIPAHIDEIAARYEAHGMVIFPGLLDGCPEFEAYLSDIRWMLSKLYARAGRKLESDDLGDIIATLATFDPKAGQIVADMGTQPNKFFSANRLKFSAWMHTILTAIMGENAVSATPHAGDTLHLFMPGKPFHRYNLPIHQDYQFLMQSPKQTTLYMGLSAFHPGVGGLEYWPGSQRLGVLNCKRNAAGSFELDASAVSGLQSRTAFWDVGDVAVFNSLMVHRSIENETADKGRAVQIMRFSDLNNADAEALDWRSTTYPRRGVAFEDAYHGASQSSQLR